mgnify:FL=1
MYIFVYGTLRQGMRLHHYLFQDEFIGDAVLSDATMYDLGEYPAVVLRGNKNVYGELYFITLATLRILDNLEGVSESEQESLFCRERQLVKLTNNNSVINAYIYLYNQPIASDCTIVAYGDYRLYLQRITKEGFYAR